MKRDLSFKGNEPLLYLIATPIGNMQEVSPRAKAILEECDFVCAEDTRNAGKLLSLLGIKKSLISCHEHNEEEASAKIISLLLEGKKVCYMSDAGYPTISDPGGRLVANCLKNDIKVSVVSGPNAAINALACSGLDSSHFYFHGFLPPKESERNATLQQLANKEETLIFYESPHRIGMTLIALAASLGNRKAVIARELTKAHEEFIRGNLPELALLDPETLIGEMVIVVEGRSKEANAEMPEEQIALALRDELEWGKTPKEAIASVSKNCNLPKNKVYAIYLKHFKD